MNMKFFLRLIGSTIVTTSVTTSLVACGGSSIANNPQLNGKYAMLLGWYSDENTTNIDEVISFDQNNNCIITADNEKIIKEHLFKDSLLVTGSSGEKFKAKDVTAAAFLADLGFLSGNQVNDYSESDTKAITNLVATVKTANPGKITADATGFKVAAGGVFVRLILWVIKQLLL